MLNFYNSYIDLGDNFFKRCLPQKVASPALVLWNSELANSLLISPALQNNYELLSQYFSGQQIATGCESIALAYSGHQFGHFNPNLGDGRAHLLGELLDSSGVRHDVQLKGSGQTPFSRRGDGKCALGPALREYIMSEALYALDVPTSRCLAVVVTGELINRGLAKPGAIVTRVAASHIRVGSFQYFAARGDTRSLKKLLDYSIERHFRELNTGDYSGSRLCEQQRILRFLEAVLDKQITLIISWLRIGFVHGVMNTDNTTICGETIDYGPCAMMGVYNEKTVFSSIDEYGRYAFANQGKIAQWNMARLADCLLLLLTEQMDTDNIDTKDPDVSSNHDNVDVNTTKQQALKKVEAIIHQFTPKFEQAYYSMYANKLGMEEVNADNKVLIDELLTIMQAQNLDYTQTFYRLTKLLSSNQQEEQLTAKLGDWYQLWQATLKRLNITKQQAEQLMIKNNPVVIPRNHHIEALLTRCEEVAINNKNSVEKQTIIANMVDEFLGVLHSPYQEVEATKNYQDTPKDHDKYYQTFCGT